MTADVRRDLGICTLYMLLYLAQMCWKYFSQWRATIGRPFLSRKRKPLYPCTTGSTFGGFLLASMRAKHSFTSGVMGTILVPQPVLGSSITYSMFRVLWSWWSTIIRLFSNRCP